MVSYGIFVGIIAFVVNFLLLLGTNRLVNSPSRFGFVALGALMGALHTAICTASGFLVFSGFAWNVFALFLSGILAFGPAFGKCLLYGILSMALTGLTAGTGGGLWMNLCGAIGILFLCFRLVQQRREVQDLMPVELTYGQEKVCIWALRDTGNNLKDPISGQSVLIVGPKVAEKLVGLTQKQLEHPVEAVGDLPGLRLIPFHTIGQSTGLLLGMRLPSIKIGKWVGSSIVAFAPYGLGDKQLYQGLTGVYL